MKILAKYLFACISRIAPTQPGFAATLAEYRESVDYAWGYVMELRRDAAMRKSDAVSDRELVARIRESLSPSEKVEWEGGVVETSNQWLNARLDAFTEEPDAAMREAILLEIEERLAAVSARLAELKNPATAGRTKDQDKQKLGEILRRPEYQKPDPSAQEESILQRWLLEFFVWLVSLFPTPAAAPQNSEGMRMFANVLTIAVFVVLFGLLAFGVYKFAPGLFPGLRRRKKEKKKERVILGERIGADESASDLFAEAERIALSGDMRGAIRKGYVALLCELSDRKIIGLARHKTNRDYLRDLRQRGDLQANVGGMTSSFERHWYGHQNSDSNDWEEFRRGYRETVAKI
jgi:hypothetical protein